jgi:putative molybdopterin biosynthesis protein
VSITTRRGRLSPQNAYARWTEACAAAGWRGSPVPEKVHVADGLDRVLAEPVQARWPSPRCDCAAMDGIAMGGPAAAGEVIPATAFAWVDTGDPVPAWADTVVAREQTQIRSDGSAVVTAPARRGLNVRTRGEDFAVGARLVPAGRRLRPADLAAAAAAGHATLLVTRQPVVAIVPTGDEVRPVGTPLGRGDIVDSNSVMLAARAAQAGAWTAVSEVQPDDPTAIAAAVRRAAAVADLVLVLAGSSVGRDDHTAAVLGEVGVETVHGVAVRPGHPVLLGHARAGQRGQGEVPGGQQVPRPRHAAVPVIGVPGYPLAAAVIFELFGVPVLAALHGRPIAGPGHAQLAVLDYGWTSAPDVEEWIPVTLSAASAPVTLPLATPCKGRGAGTLTRLVYADAWWRHPIGQGQIHRGDLIEVFPTAGAPEFPITRADG